MFSINREFKSATLKESKSKYLDYLFNHDQLVDVTSVSKDDREYSRRKVAVIEEELVIELEERHQWYKEELEEQEATNSDYLSNLIER